ncbi:unnamed protein product [Ixodes pacificus]
MAFWRLVTGAPLSDIFRLGFQFGSHMDVACGPEHEAHVTFRRRSLARCPPIVHLKHRFPSANLLFFTSNVRSPVHNSVACFVDRQKKQGLVIFASSTEAAGILGLSGLFFCVSCRSSTTPAPSLLSTSIRRKLRISASSSHLRHRRNRAALKRSGWKVVR